MFSFLKPKQPPVSEYTEPEIIPYNIQFGKDIFPCLIARKKHKVTGEVYYRHTNFCGFWNSQITPSLKRFDSEEEAKTWLSRNNETYYDFEGIDYPTPLKISD